MDGQKIDTQLQLSLALTPEERERSPELETGYEPVLREWELIIKYSGDLSRLKEALSLTVTPLLNEYAIIRIRESDIDRLSDYSEIEYIEKPKSLILEETEGMRASCIPAVREAPLSLTGAGTVIAVVDSGIDYTHPDFRNADGSTRILSLWDQSVAGDPPAPYTIGSVYTAEAIDRALAAESMSERLRQIPETDLSGHGTHVAGIAAGNGRASGGRYIGAAPEAGLLIVKLAAASARSFPRTSELMQGIDWAVRYCMERRLPLAVNISFGNNYGNHEGGSLLEQYIDDVSNLGRTIVVVGAGNEGNKNRHAGGTLPAGVRSYSQRQSWEREIEFTVSPYETGLNVQLWKEYGDEIEIGIRTPSGAVLGLFYEQSRKQSAEAGQTTIALYYGEPTPYSTLQEIYIALIPRESYIEAGVWSLLLYPRYIRDGGYQLWLPAVGGTEGGTGFLRPEVLLTLTIPASASRAVTVGAYDPQTDSYAPFSGRGEEAVRSDKPDLAAPGVDITAPAPGGGYDTRSGTSMAAPFVTGGAALLMEWGIVRGNDAYLYGEKLKAYLIRGARALPGFSEFPNAQVGWGALCIARSIPQER